MKTLLKIGVEINERVPILLWSSINGREANFQQSLCVWLRLMGFDLDNEPSKTKSFIRDVPKCDPS